MLYMEIIAVCSEIHTKYINLSRRQKRGNLNTKICGTHNNHWVYGMIHVQIIYKVNLLPKLTCLLLV
jgi:hypothetical protein